MSRADLLNKEHIDVLVTAAIAANLIEEDQASSLGDLLWQENVKSLHYRYGDANEFWDLPAPGSYRFQPTPVENPFYVFKQISVYENQASEHDTYWESDACRVMDTIKEHIYVVTGLDEGEMWKRPEWEAAVWGVDLDENGNILWNHEQYRAFLERQRVADYNRKRAGL